MQVDWRNEGHRGGRQGDAWLQHCRAGEGKTDGRLPSHSSVTASENGAIPRYSQNGARRNPSLERGPRNGRSGACSRRGDRCAVGMLLARSEPSGVVRVRKRADGAVFTGRIGADLKAGDGRSNHRAGNNRSVPSHDRRNPKHSHGRLASGTKHAPPEKKPIHLHSPKGPRVVPKRIRCAIFVIDAG